MTRILACIAALAALAAAPAPASAQATKEQLKSQFDARATDLRELKRRAVIGETLEGYVEAVPGAAPDDKAAAVVRDENADRRRLYQILADEINREHPDAKVKATIETIAVRNAARNIEHARPDEFLRVAKGHWIRVRDYPRYQRLQALKAQGKVGETAAGLVEAVNPGDNPDQDLARFVSEENAARTAEYNAAARAEGIQPSAVATRTARRNFDNARAGDMLKDEGGTWRKK